MASLAALLAPDSVDARKKRKRKKKKKNKKPKCQDGTKLCGATCIPTGTYGSDAGCPTSKGETCQAGMCKCPTGQGYSQGVCGSPPLQCVEPQVPCDQGTCCSGKCAANGGAGVCALGAAGTPCIRTDYCTPGLECIGFIRRAA